MALGNKYSVDVDHGTLISLYPIEIESAHDSLAAVFTLSNGLGYTAVTISDLSQADGWILEINVSGIWQKVDQSVQGNDYWQANFDIVSQTYSLTYNIHNRGTNQYWLRRAITSERSPPESQCTSCYENASIAEDLQIGKCACKAGFVGTAEGCQEIRFLHQEFN